ncbi:unnamed protein product [Owenia fusiformis]|uniref:Uncharacterized protein n=1 Tax=Owenia fusiformis TaxID=6347 RepID=A0A8S4N320_OWEFU|nr:unnamed protein product [Owenia fusiformis]
MQDDDFDNMMDPNQQYEELSEDQPNIQNPGRSYATPYLEDKMRRKLKFYFMNPCEKWQARKRFPWKLLMQVIKLIAVTLQLVLFGYDRTSHVTFLEKNVVTFQHLYLKGWDISYETMPYPPSHGVFAVYEHDELFRSIDYTLEKYNDTKAIALGSYDFVAVNGSKPDPKLCITRYKHGEIWAFNESFYFNNKKVYQCTDLSAVQKHNASTNSTYMAFDTKQFLADNNASINFDRMIKLELMFSLKSVHLRTLSPFREPDCFQFDIGITFDNSGHNGQIAVTLLATAIHLECHGKIANGNNLDQATEVGYAVFDVFVIFISFLSLILCTRSIIRAQILKKECKEFFKKQFNKELDVWDLLEFLNMWYVMIVINDILTIVGSIFKIQIDYKGSHDYETCGVLLGTGSMLVWFGVLRYLGFFEQYNILVLTMKKATPNILRFLVCAAVFYFGFTFCGWVVLGPYHVKFRTLSATSETLFSLVNGDDMFVTFSAITTENRPNLSRSMWLYSRIYLYAFISLFIYVVLSLFIAVIMDTYETIKHYYNNGFPKSRLFEFIGECEDGPDCPLYRSEDQTQGCSCWTFLCCCKHLRDPDEPNEHSHLIRT